jgi:hypothetical protein
LPVFTTTTLPSIDPLRGSGDANLAPSAPVTEGDYAGRIVARFLLGREESLRMSSPERAMYSTKPEILNQGVSDFEKITR